MQFPTKQPMPGNVRAALEKRNLMQAYLERPEYQRDDYLKWIALAAGPLAKQKRLDQMLDELQKGNVFKGEPWTPPEKQDKAEKPAEKPSGTPAVKSPGKPPGKPPAKPSGK